MLKDNIFMFTLNDTLNGLTKIETSLLLNRTVVSEVSSHFLDDYIYVENIHLDTSLFEMYVSYPLIHISAISPRHFQLQNI